MSLLIASLVVVAVLLGMPSTRPRLARLGAAPGSEPPPTPASPTELALFGDLLGAALLAGEPVESALEVVVTAVAAPWGRPLLVRAGTVVAGGAVTATDGSSATLLRALRRSGASGAKLASQLQLSADDLRTEEAAAALERARRVSVHGVLPLGLCCLPAFMLLAVVPLAAGLVSGLR